MAKKSQASPKREASLSRDRIVEAAIELLDASGEGGLTFRALSERLDTGAGALYWHVANKSDLLTAACDAVIARALDAITSDASPKEAIRAVSLAVFDAMDAHPWIGSALLQAPGGLPMVRVFERLGRQLRALDVQEAAQWTTVSALLSYVVGVGSLNAANAQVGRARGADRAGALAEVAQTWSRLPADEFPFTRGIAGQLAAHDDRVDFVAGIDLVLAGLEKPARR